MMRRLRSFKGNRSQNPSRTHELGICKGKFLRQYGSVKRVKKGKYEDRIIKEEMSHARHLYYEL